MFSPLSAQTVMQNDRYCKAFFIARMTFQKRFDRLGHGAKFSGSAVRLALVQPDLPIGGLCKAVKNSSRCRVIAMFERHDY